ncbi:MAG: translation elongation factor Ts [Actinobacteria bacterium]|nr:translation elongation factor Ts [Actinomycetota bacterium]
MEISAKEVKKLRDSTGAGMMDAKEALKESDGNVDEAIKLLRKKGLADSKKRDSKDANEGVIGSYTHMQQGRAVSGVIVELACETDFVAKSSEFIELSQQIAMHIAALRPRAVEKDDITNKDIEDEREILISQGEAEGKEGQILNKYVDGKINSFYKDNVLLEQVFCNPDFYEGKVGDMINEISGRLGEKIYIKRFSRLEIGSS